MQVWWSQKVFKIVVEFGRKFPRGEKKAKQTKPNNTLKFLFITYDVSIKLKGSCYPIFLAGSNLPADTYLTSFIFICSPLLKPVSTTARTSSPEHMDCFLCNLPVLLLDLKDFTLCSLSCSEFC